MFTEEEYIFIYCAQLRTRRNVKRCLRFPQKARNYFTFKVSGGVHGSRFLYTPKACCSIHKQEALNEYKRFNVFLKFIYAG